MVGYFPEGTDEACFFCDGMDKEQAVSIHPGDQLIVVTYGNHSLRESGNGV